MDAFENGIFDLVIVGGGITGAGVALDATLRGWKVALIDKGDFASGTSSLSSKLIHGGFRYLEHGGFRLVYEALHERRLLLENASHLVWPLRFVIPFYENARVPVWKWRAGLTLYDLLAGSSNIRQSRPISAAALSREFPLLKQKDLRGGAEYFDAQMDDARLCLDVVKTATLYGACAANYVEAVGFERTGGVIDGVQALDKVGRRPIKIRGRQVLNATGPWSDAVSRLAGQTAGSHLRPTKGVHLIAGDCGLRAAFLLLHPRDGRVFFVIPWSPTLRTGGAARKAGPQKTLIGTTDTECEESPDGVKVSASEIAYLLEGYNHYFSSPLGSTDIMGSFAGLRPLLRSDGQDPSAFSREFQIFDEPSGLMTVAGGKYTTYRRMAELVTDAVGQRLQRTHRCRTRVFPLDGAPRDSWRRFASLAVPFICETYNLSEQAGCHMVGRYGRRAYEVAALLKNNPGLAKPIAQGEPDLSVEIAYQREHEMAIYPADFLVRRTRLGWFHPELFQNLPPAMEEQK